MTNEIFVDAFLSTMKQYRFQRKTDKVTIDFKTLEQLEQALIVQKLTIKSLRDINKNLKIDKYNLVSKLAKCDTNYDYFEVRG